MYTIQYTNDIWLNVALQQRITVKYLFVNLNCKHWKYTTKDSLRIFTKNTT